MNIEKLIDLVFKNRCLWDQNDSRYHLRIRHRTAWAAISDELNVEAGELKKKWRGLRDTFVKEFKKSNYTTCQNGDREISRWPYYKLMLFLQDSISCKDSNGCSTDAHSDEIFLTEADDSRNPLYEQYSEQEGPILKKNLNTTIKREYIDVPNSPSLGYSMEQDADQVQRKKFKSYQTINYNSLDNIDRGQSQTADEKLPCMQDNDPDVHFLMSLLPFLKDVPKNRKLIVRSKLEQVFIDEQNSSEL